MNVLEIKKENCCGCSACMAVCPNAAIEMVNDEQGFLYPNVKCSACVDCGLCLKTCQEKGVGENLIRAYAAKNADPNIQYMASSGGISYALAKKMIEMGGVIYGVIYDEDHHACHYRASTLQECNLFFGSKYVQSDPRHTLRSVQKDLSNGVSVLYIGTSCYIAGLKSYLQNVGCSHSKLITCDLICHGVPSPKLFNDYIDFLKKDPLFDHFEFRTKKLPWGYGSKTFGCTIYRKDGSQWTDTIKARLFLTLFFSNNCIRPCCYKCPFVGVNKPADITIADFWGLMQEHPDFFDEKGVSAVITHNQRGEQFFRSCDVIWIDSSIEKIARKQANMEHPSPQNSNYDDFWSLYRASGFEAVARKYGGYNLKGYIRHSKMYFFYRKIRGY